MNKEEKDKLISEFIKLKLQNHVRVNWLYGVDLYCHPDIIIENHKSYPIRHLRFYHVKNEDAFISEYFDKCGLYYRWFDELGNHETKRLFLMEIPDG